jgi:hypothetical protein
MMKATLMVALMSALSIVIVFLLANQFYRLLKARREAVEIEVRKRIEDEIRSQVRWYRELALIFGPVYAIFRGVPWAASRSSEILTRMVDLLGLHSTQVIVAIAAFALAILAHYENRRHQFRFGVIEMAFGIATAVAVFGLGATITPLAIFGGCVYVVCRGLNNVCDRLSKIRKERQEDVVYDLAQLRVARHLTGNF